MMGHLMESAQTVNELIHSIFLVNWFPRRFESGLWTLCLLGRICIYSINVE